MLEQVAKIIADHFGVSESDITLETKIKEDLNADSLDVVELIMDLEDALGVKVDDEQAAGMTTVADIVKYVEANQN